MENYKKLMRKTELLRLFALLSIVVGLGWLNSGLALAHETRPVTGGKYSLRVGFISEPTYQGLENGLELTVCNGDCVTSKDGSGILTNGVSGAFDTLKAEVIFGSQSMTLTLIPVARQPGRYNARFVPTRAGDYTFHIFGKLNSDPIDERFTSGPDTFDSVQPLANEQFPDKPGFPQANANPTAQSAATSPALTSVATPATNAPATTPAPVPTISTTQTSSPAQIQDLRAQLTVQQKQLDEARSNASSASTLGFIGIGAGLIGLVVAVVALFLRRPVREPERG